MELLLAVGFVVLVIVGFVMWNSDQQAKASVERFQEQRRSFNEGPYNELVEKGELPSEGDGRTFNWFGLLALEKGDTALAIEAFRRGKEMGDKSAAANLNSTLEAARNSNEK